MIDAFTEKYGIKINSANPDGSSQDEINAVTSQKGQDRAPDVLDVGTSFALPGRRRRTCSRRTRWPPGTTSPTTRRTPTGTGTTTTAATSRSAATPRRSRSARRRFDGPARPAVRGQVALNGNPTQAGAAFGGVWAASLANGGSLDDIGPGIDFFVKLKKAGNFNPVEITPATIQNGETPISHRLGLRQRRPGRASCRGRASTGRSTSRPTACSAASTTRPSASSRRTRPPPGCGRSSSTATRARTSGSRAAPARSGCRRCRRPAPPTPTALKALPAGRGHRRVPDRRSSRPRPRRSSPTAGTRRCPAEYRTSPTPAAPAPRSRGPARPRAGSALGALPFFLYVAVFLLLPVGVLAVEAFRATDPITFQDDAGPPTRSPRSPRAPTGRAYLGSLRALG